MEESKCHEDRIIATLRELQKSIGSSSATTTNVLTTSSQVLSLVSSIREECDAAKKQRLEIEKEKTELLNRIEMIKTQKLELEKEMQIQRLKRCPPWVPDDRQIRCFKCFSEFTLLNRKHHCRMCGNIFDSACSNHFVPIPLYGYQTPVRVCDTCFVENCNPSNNLLNLHSNATSTEGSVLSKNSRGMYQKSLNSSNSQVQYKISSSSSSSRIPIPPPLPPYTAFPLATIKPLDTTSSKVSRSFLNSSILSTLSSSDSPIKKLNVNFLQEISSGRIALKRVDASSSSSSSSQFHATPHKLKEIVNEELRNSVIRNSMLKRRSAIVGTTPEQTSPKKSATVTPTQLQINFDERIENSRRKKIRQYESDHISSMIPKNGSIANAMARKTQSLNRNSPRNENEDPNDWSVI